MILQIIIVPGHATSNHGFSSPNELYTLLNMQLLPYKPSRALETGYSLCSSLYVELATADKFEFADTIDQDQNTFCFRILYTSK